MADVTLPREVVKRFEKKAREVKRLRLECAVLRAGLEPRAVEPFLSTYRGEPDPDEIRSAFAAWRRHTREEIGA